MPAMITTSRSPEDLSHNAHFCPRVLQVQASSPLVKAETESEYFCEPAAISPHGYDTEIDNISDLDLNSPAATSHFTTHIEPSGSYTPAEISAHEGYDADDEGTKGSLENLGIGVAHQIKGSSMITEDKQDDSHSTTQPEFMRYMAQGWTLDPEASQDADPPASALLNTLLGSSSSISYDSKFSCSPRWTRQHYSLEGQESDEEMSNVPRSPSSSKNLSAVRGSVEYFDLFAGQRHYPEAVEFFAVNLDTGLFKDVLTTPPSDDRDLSVSPPSPFTRPDDYGLIEEWNFSNSQEPQASPVSPLPTYSQFEDDSRAVSPLSEYSSRFERESGVVGLGIEIGPLISEPVPDLFSSLSSTSSSDGELFSAEELLSQLNDLVFDSAAYEFFSAIGVQGLLADQITGEFTLEDHDELHHFWELEHGWPYLNWLPHDPKRGCHCQWCTEYWMFDGDEDMYRPHDFDHRCSCPVCQSFRCEEQAREMKEQEQKQYAHDPEELRVRKRKRQHVESQLVDQDTRHQLRSEILEFKAAQEIEEDQAMNESVRNCHPKEERRSADLPLWAVDDEFQRPDQRVEKSPCLGLFRWIKQILRQPLSA